MQHTAGDTLLVMLFGSLLDSLVILCATPSGMIGVGIGHALLGHHLQFFSAVGVLTLTGH